MSTQHTPGPWRVGPNGGFGLGPVNAVFTAESALCGDLIANLKTEPTNPNMEADARLIAAAPDLLEALKAMLENRGDYTELRDTARAAIAKATGEQA